MISLLRAETRRLTARRLARILAVVALLIIVVVEGRAFLKSNRDLTAAHRRAAATAQRAQRENAVFADRARKQCESEKAAGQIPPSVNCDEVNFGPDGSNEIPADAFYKDPRLDGQRALRDGTRAVAVGVSLMAFLVGASYVGAEWHAGTMQALLFWEPRRGRVLLAKGTALVVVLLAFHLAIQGLTYGMTYVTAATRGSTAGVTAGFHVSNLLVLLRGSIVIAFTGLLGYAVAGLARITGAALGVAFVYFAIIENLVRGLRPGWQRFLVSENISAVMFKKVDVAPAGARSLMELVEGEGRRAYELTGGRGTFTLALYLAILLGVFYLTFSRRDVT